MRSAVFLPTPGIRVSRATSPRCTAWTRSAASIPESTARASLGPMPLMPISRSNTASSKVGEEAEQRQRVLAHVGVDAQRDVGAGVADGVEGRHRHGDVVAHAVHVEDHAGGRLLDQAPASARRSRTRGPAAGRGGPLRRRVAGRAIGPPAGQRRASGASRRSRRGHVAGQPVHVAERHGQRVGGVVRRRRARRARAAA